MLEFQSKIETVYNTFGCTDDMVCEHVQREGLNKTAVENIADITCPDPHGDGGGKGGKGRKKRSSGNVGDRPSGGKVRK